MLVLRENLERKLLKMKQFPNYGIQPKSTLYHNTKFDRLESILDKGILLSYSRYPDYEGNGIWATSTPNMLGYGHCTIAFDSTDYDLEKVNRDEYRVWEDISPDDIIFVDVPVLFPNRLSDLPRLIDAYGYDKVMGVLEKKRDFPEISMKTIKDLLKRVGY